PRAWAGQGPRPGGGPGPLPHGPPRPFPPPALAPLRGEGGPAPPRAAVLRPARPQRAAPTAHHRVRARAPAAPQGRHAGAVPRPLSPPARALLLSRMGRGAPDGASR